MSEVPLYRRDRDEFSPQQWPIVGTDSRKTLGSPCHYTTCSSLTSRLESNEEGEEETKSTALQGYLAHKKLRPPWDRHRALGIVLL